MKRTVVAFILLTVLVSAAWAATLGTAANGVIPADVQQIIAVDYRRLADSPTALALKDRVLPDNLKQFETALRGVDINVERDVDHLTFASFRTPSSGVRIIGIAQGQFARAKVLKRMRMQKIRFTKVRSSRLYPMPGGLTLTFLDDWTLLFGDNTAVKFALDARDGEVQSLNYNTRITGLIEDAEGGAVWSVLDAEGAQHLMRSALGDASRLADYETVKKRLLGSTYTMTFDQGVKFDLDVLTSDSMTAATLSSLIRAGVLFKKMNSSGVEKMALESVSIDSDSAKLRIHFRSDDKQFQSLLHSDLFTAISR